MREALLELGDLVLEHRLRVLGIVVLRVLRDVSELAGNTRSARRFHAGLLGAQLLELLLVRASKPSG